MGDINVIELVLLAIVTFIFAIDQFSLTELIYRPMIACPIIGVILGDPATGLAIGGTYELMMVGNMPIGGAQPPNAVLGGIVAMIFAVKADMPINTALGACMIFATFGQYVVTLVFTATSALMAKADKAAEEANPKGITACLNIHMAGLGALFTVIAIVAYVGGTAAAPTLESFAKNYSWVMAGLGAAGAIEAIACLKALETGIIPPTINLLEPDPECDLDYVPNTAREKKIDIALSNSLGFGGHNACLAFRRV